MGETGRGLSEHFRIPATAVDVIVASLENACASVGGFVAGDTGVVAYQRLMEFRLCVFGVVAASA